MIYASVDDIDKRYGEDFLYTIADRNQDDTLDTAAIERSLSDASDLMNSYLATRYTLPIMETLPILSRACVDIAVYWLSEDAGVATEERRTRYDDAISWLERVTAGKTDLPIQQPDEPTKTPGGLVSYSPRLFTRQNLRGW